MAKYDEEINAILINEGHTILPLEVLRENDQFAEKTIDELLEYYTKIEENANKKKRIEQIDEELEEIDKSTGINRQLEDIIEKTGIFDLMYTTTQETIQKKKDLREERKTLKTEIIEIE